MSSPTEPSSPARAAHSDNWISYPWLATLLVLAAGVLHLAAILHAEPLQSANDRSRWCTVRALLEQRTYRIDDVRSLPGWDTIDLIRRDGHFYSTKPPLMATWVAGVVELEQRISGWSFSHHFRQIHSTTLLVINLLPFLLGLAGLAWWLRNAVDRVETAVFVLATAAFGTLLTPFLTSLNNHTPAAMGVLVALLCWQSGEPTAAWSRYARFAAWGAAASWAVCHDLPAAALALVMFVIAARQSLARTLLAFVPAALIPALAFLACNYFAMGSLIPAYSGYGGDTYRFIHNGVPSYWLQPQGIDRNLDSPPIYFLNCLVGHHGWFLLTPVWLLALLPGKRTGSAAESNRRLLRLATFAVSAVVLGFYLTRTQNYNYGGVSCGLRWAIFLTPMWLMSLAIAVDPWTQRWDVRAVAAVFLGVSIFSAWYPMSRAWQQPWAYQLAESWGWVPGKDPPPALPRSLYSWFPTLPEVAGDGVPIWVEFQRTDPPGSAERLRLTLTGDRIVQGRVCAEITAERFLGETVIEARRLLVDRQRFAEGRSSAECLVWTDPKTTPDEQQADLTFYRALPRLKPYHPGYERYIHLPLRGDAFACQRAAAQCDHPRDPGTPMWRHRSDLWLSREIPFGTARMEWTISDPRTGEFLQRETWVAADCHPPVSPQSPVTIEMFDKNQPVFQQVGP